MNINLENKEKYEKIKKSISDMQTACMNTGEFHTGMVNEGLIEKQLSEWSSKVRCERMKILAISDYGEYVAPLKDKYGDFCDIYCVPTSYYGFEMCKSALSVYVNNPEDFVIFNMEKIKKIGFNEKYIEYIMKSKNMMFDKVVGNPPFASRGNNLHLKIMKCVLDYCGGELNFIMPSKPIIEQVDEGWYNMFVDARCYKIEVVSKNCFEGTEMDDVAIYYCDKSKSLDEYSKRLDVDIVVYAAVSDEGRMLIDTMCKFQNVNALPYTKEKAKNTDWIDKCVHYLIVSRDNGSSNGQWQSDILNKYPVMNGSEVVEKLKNRKKQSPVNLIECHNKLYGENLKTLMTEGKVLRYALWIRQSDRHMYEKVFKYVPDIAYDKLIGNTPRELDNSLLLFCGCSQDKADKILNYLDIFDFKKSRNNMVRDFDLKDLKK